jgi:hypothetical protein
MSKLFSVLALKALMEVFFITPYSKINVNLCHLPVYVKKIIVTFSFPFLLTQRVSSSVTV